MQVEIRLSQEDIASKCNRSIKAVKKFTQRLFRLKHLLLDEAVDLEEYRNIKSDIENKIEMLGEIVSSCTKDKNDLLKRTETVLYRFNNPHSGFATLAAEQKREWLRIMLTTDWIWNENDILEASLYHL